MSSGILRQHLPFNTYSLFDKCPHEALKKKFFKIHSPRYFFRKLFFEYADF